MRFIDANIILRYLLEDDSALSNKATTILTQGATWQMQMAE